MLKILVGYAHYIFYKYENNYSFPNILENEVPFNIVKVYLGIFLLDHTY